MTKQNPVEISQGSTNSHHSSSTSTKESSSCTKTSTTARVKQQNSNYHHSRQQHKPLPRTVSKFGNTLSSSPPTTLNTKKETVGFFNALPTYLRVLIIVALIIGAIAFYIYVIRKKNHATDDDEDAEDEEDADDVEENQENFKIDTQEKDEKHVHFEDGVAGNSSDFEPQTETEDELQPV